MYPKYRRRNTKNKWLSFECNDMVRRSSSKQNNKCDAAHDPM